MASITSADAVLMLSVSGLFDTPQQIEQFTTDDIFNSEQVKRIETRMGVDGVLSAGLVFNEKRMTIHLQSNSPSIALFDEWIAQEEQAVDAFAASMTITLKGLGTKFNLYNGYLTDSPPLPDVKKVVEPRAYTLVWESIVPQPV